MGTITHIAEAGSYTVDVRLPNDIAGSCSTRFRM